MFDATCQISLYDGYQVLHLTVDGFTCLAKRDRGDTFYSVRFPDGREFSVVDNATADTEVSLTDMRDCGGVDLSGAFATLKRFENY